MLPWARSLVCQPFCQLQPGQSVVVSGLMLKKHISSRSFPQGSANVPQGSLSLAPTADKAELQRGVHLPMMSQSPPSKQAVGPGFRGKGRFWSENECAWCGATSLHPHPPGRWMGPPAILTPREGELRLRQGATCSHSHGWRVVG